jgi:hypothetical protein
MATTWKKIEAAAAAAGLRVQRTMHGAGRASVQLFSSEGLVADVPAATRRGGRAVAPSCLALFAVEDFVERQRRIAAGETGKCSRCGDWDEALERGLCHPCTCEE